MTNASASESRSEGGEYTVLCRRCRGSIAISAAERADMLINGGGFTHTECAPGEGPPVTVSREFIDNAPKTDLGRRP